MKMHPGTMLTYVGHFKKVGIETCALARSPKGRLVKSRRARGHDHPVQLVLPYVRFDLLLPGLRAGVKRILCEYNPGQIFSIFGYYLAVDRAADVFSAMANINTDPQIVGT